MLNQLRFLSLWPIQSPTDFKVETMSYCFIRPVLPVDMFVLNLEGNVQVELLYNLIQLLSGELPRLWGTLIHLNLFVVIKTCVSLH